MIAAFYQTGVRIPTERETFPTEVEMLRTWWKIRGVPKGEYTGIYIPKLPKLGSTTDAEYVANLVSVSMWL